MCPASDHSSSNTYQHAGVSIEAGDALVEAIKPAVKATTIKGTMGGLGGFGALFDLKAAGFKDPVLVSCTDGVGTKLMIAIESGLHEQVGIDLVAMCVNDLVVQGARPLFFLDYFATGKLCLEDAATIVKGIAEGCKQSGCALVGGETAEMPGMYAKGHYDLAGFSVGAAERAHLLPKTLTPGDSLIGLPSSGVHSNGFSLVRHIVKGAGLTWADKAPFADNEKTLGAAFMTPTSLYVHPLLALHEAGLLKGAAHITGGGLAGNVPRILPAGVKAVIEGKNWPVPTVFTWLAQTGKVETMEMLKVFNCGVGMVVVTNEPHKTQALLAEKGQTSFLIGQLEKTQTAPALEFKTLPSFT